METLKRIIWNSTPILRFLLGALFIYAGVAKLADVSTFAGQLRHFGVENPTLATLLAHYLPFLEIACGVAFFFRRFTAGAAMLYACLLILFEGALAYAWGSGFKGDCGCFGKLFGGSSIPFAFFRNLGLLACVSMVLAREWLLCRRIAQ